jgi:GTP-binding protein Era
MVSMALSALADSDVCLWVVDGLRQGPEHQKMLELVCAQKDLPVLAAINKADLMTPTDLDVLSSSLKDSTPAVDVLTISAKTGRGLRKLKRALIPLLPLSPPLFDGETLTDQSLRAIAAEYIREAVFELTHKEIPYSTAVTIDSFAEPDPTDLNPLCRISATVHVERDSQKKVMIGHRGQMLKAIGQTARLRLEDFLEMRVFLSLFVRITKDWSANERALSEFGYLDRH